MRRFLVVWIGQFVSLFGSVLTGFALGVDLYQTTNSIFQFALIAVFTLLPGVLAAPIIGPLIDRWGRKRSMLFSDAGSAVLTGTIIILLVNDYLLPWHIYTYAALNSILGAIQWPAYVATVAVLVPSEQLPRANALVGSSRAVANLGAPALAGALVGSVGLWSVVAIDLITFVCAIVTLAATAIPDPISQDAEGDAEADGGFLQNALYGLRYIIARPGLVRLQIFFALGNVCIGLWEVLITPLVLSFATTTQLGLVWSAGGAGILSGNLIVLLWGGPKQRIPVMLGSSLMIGIGLFLSGVGLNLALIALGCFMILCFGNIENNLTESIWQSKVQPEAQGRVFTFEEASSYMLLPISYLLAEPLVIYVFTPLAGVLSGEQSPSTAQGIGLLLMLSGGLFIIGALFSYLHPRVRRLEQELPDYHPAVS